MGPGGRWWRIAAITVLLLTLNLQIVPVAAATYELTAVWTYSIPGVAVTAVAFSSDGTRIAVGTDDNRIFLLTSTGSEEFNTTLSPHPTEPVNRTVVTDNGILSYANRTIYLYRNDGSKAWEFTNTSVDPGLIIDIEALPDESIITLTTPNTTTILNQSATILTIIKPSVYPGSYFTDCDIEPDGSAVLCAESGNYVAAYVEGVDPGWPTRDQLIIVNISQSPPAAPVQHVDLSPTTLNITFRGCVTAWDWMGDNPAGIAVFKTRNPATGALSDPLPFFIRTGSQAWGPAFNNSPTTHSLDLWVRYPTLPGKGNATVYIVPVSPAPPGPAEPEAVFDVYDDFEGPAGPVNRTLVNLTAQHVDETTTAFISLDGLGNLTLQACPTTSYYEPWIDFLFQWPPATPIKLLANFSEWTMTGNVGEIGFMDNYDNDPAHTRGPYGNGTFNNATIWATSRHYHANQSTVGIWDDNPAYINSQRVITYAVDPGAARARAERWTTAGVYGSWYNLLHVTNRIYGIPYYTPQHIALAPYALAGATGNISVQEIMGWRYNVTAGWSQTEAYQTYLAGRSDQPKYSYSTRYSITEPRTIDIDSTGKWVGVSATSTHAKVYYTAAGGFSTAYTYASASGAPTAHVEVSGAGSFGVEGRGGGIFDVVRLDGVRVGTYTAGGVVNSVTISDSGLWSLMGSEDGILYLFGKQSSSSWQLIDSTDPGDPVRVVDLLGDGSYGVAGTSGGDVTYYTVGETTTGAFNQLIHFVKDGSPAVGYTVKVEDGGTDQASWTTVLAAAPTDSNGNLVFAATTGHYYRVTVDGEVTIIQASASYTTLYFQWTSPPAYPEWGSAFNVTNGTIDTFYRDPITVPVTVEIKDMGTRALVFCQTYTTNDLSLSWVPPAGNHNYQMRITASRPMGTTGGVFYAKTGEGSALQLLPIEGPALQILLMAFLMVFAGLFGYVHAPVGALAVSLVALWFNYENWLTIPWYWTQVCVLIAFMAMLARGADI